MPVHFDVEQVEEMKQQTRRRYETRPVRRWLLNIEREHEMREERGERTAGLRAP
jgi:hypothetical protein